jgi:hypothetical protein
VKTVTPVTAQHSIEIALYLPSLPSSSPFSSFPSCLTPQELLSAALPLHRDEYKGLLDSTLLFTPSLPPYYPTSPVEEPEELYLLVVRENHVNVSIAADDDGALVVDVSGD